MNIKKLVIICTFFIFAIDSFSLPALARLKDSPTKGYWMVLSKDTAYMSKVNGKSKGIIKRTFYWYDTYGSEYYEPNRVKIIHFVDEDWVKVKFSNTHSGKNEKLGFIRTKNLQTNYESFLGLVVMTNILNLRSKPSISSPVIAKIPLGTALDIYYGRK